MNNLSPQTQQLLTELNDILVSESLPEVNPSDLIDVIEDTNAFYGEVYYAVFNSSGLNYTAYKVKQLNGAYELLEAWKGTPYVVLKPIMARVALDPHARDQVTKIMSEAMSPLDLLLTQKGATGDELIPTIENMTPNELQELHDFVDGMKMTLRQAQTTSPRGAEEFYPLAVEYEEDEFEYEEAELFEDDEIDELDVDVLEIDVDYGEEASEEEDGSPSNYTSKNPASHIPERKNDNLATKLLSMFKRK